MKITAINATDREWARHRYLFSFGAYGSTVLMVWANGIDSAMDECFDWIADNEPGLLADEQVSDEYKRCLALAKMDRDYSAAPAAEIAYEHATTDTICAGNNGHYMHSWEVRVVAEDPDRNAILRLTGNPEKRRVARVRKAKASNYRNFLWTWKRKPFCRKLLTTVSGVVKVTE